MINDKNIDHISNKLYELSLKKEPICIDDIPVELKDYFMNKINGKTITKVNGRICMYFSDYMGIYKQL